MTIAHSRTSGAHISDDGLYRYELWRKWGPEDSMVWIMLNPSTADANVDDPTIRRCMGFAKREGCGGISVINLYALRATKPEHLLHHPDCEGPENVDTWEKVLRTYHRGPVVAAWGAFLAAHPEAPWPAVMDGVTAIPVQCLGRTASGTPRHPLYVKGDAPLVPLWTPS